jgi:hypothetical protein
VAMCKAGLCVPAQSALAVPLSQSPAPLVLFHSTLPPFALLQMTGLTQVKRMALSVYLNIAARGLLKRVTSGAGLDVDDGTNMLFVGNPGTGKTTVAEKSACRTCIARHLSSVSLLRMLLLHALARPHPPSFPCLSVQ